MAMTTAIPTTSSTSGATVFYPQGSKTTVIRFLASSGTYNYIVRLALTPNETPSAGHEFSSGSASAGASTLIPVATSGGTPIPCHAIYIGFSSLGGSDPGNMTVYVNSGEGD